MNHPIILKAEQDVTDYNPKMELESKFFLVSLFTVCDPKTGVGHRGKKEKFVNAHIIEEIKRVIKHMYENTM